uniref:POTRA domain-containing protein n=1 Tax=Chamaesiphon sp. OTE_75_metabat_556 TaxID=2964692 RepID=UPI00286AFB29
MFTSILKFQLGAVCRGGVGTISALVIGCMPTIGLAAIAGASRNENRSIQSPAQKGSIAQTTPTLPRPDFQRPAPQPTEAPLPTLPPSPELLPPPTTPNLPSQPTTPENLPATIVINRFEITGNTVFSPAEIEKITSQYTNKPLDFTQLLQVASEITQLYVKNGYINSGAYIPGNQSFDASGGTVEIKVIEGRVEDIVVTGTQRLDPNYIKSRIALGTGPVLKIDRLIESLQLLQLDPLIKSIGTELVSGQQPGTSIVQVNVKESPNWQTGINIANNRTPSVGEIQAQVSGSYHNLTGAGDAIGVTLGKSEGS